MTVTITRIANLPVAPLTADADTFNIRADQFFSSLPNFVTQTNISIDLINTVVTDVIQFAQSAETSAISSAAASSSPEFDSQVLYTVGQTVFSPINYQTYRRTAENQDPNTTGGDPSTDTARWTKITGLGNVNDVGYQAIYDKSLIEPILVGPKEKYQEISVNSGNINLDTSQYSVFSMTITGNTIITLQAPHLLAAQVATCVVEITNVGNNIVQWNSSIKWSKGLNPVLSSSGTDIFSFYTKNQGVTWIGNTVALGVQ
jgi:hypothetical protein